MFRDCSLTYTNLGIDGYKFLEKFVHFMLIVSIKICESIVFTAIPTFVKKMFRGCGLRNYRNVNLRNCSLEVFGEIR